MTLQARLPMPWKSAFKSAPLWAILIVHTCGSWGWYMLLIELPQYMKHILEYDLKQNAILTALPHLFLYIFSLIISKILDTLMKKKKLSTTATRKIGTSIAIGVSACCLIVVIIIECQRTIIVVMMTVAVTASGAAYSGFMANHIDIAPNYAGTLMGMTNTVATIPGIVVPIVVGELTHADPSINPWRIAFGISLVLKFIGLGTYLVWASGEVQPWNNPSQPTEVEGQ